MNVKEITIMVVCAIVLGIGSCVMLKHDKKVDSTIKSTVLPTNDKEKIIVNPLNHTVTVVTKKGTKVTNLPTHIISITEDKQGNLTIQERTWGFEHAPWVGFAFSDKPRLNLGLDVLYWHKLDLGFGIAPTFNFNSFVGTATLSYTLYSNTYVFAGMTSSKVPIAGIKLRF